MENLRRPLIALLLAPNEEMWEMALSGTKRITIREGHRDYRAGDTLMVCCHIRDSAFMATVTEVRHCWFTEVDTQEWSDDGFSSREEFEAGLKKFYPSMTTDSPVTVIRWGQLQGTSVWRSARG